MLGDGLPKTVHQGDNGTWDIPDITPTRWGGSWGGFIGHPPTPPQPTPLNSQEEERVPLLSPPAFGDGLNREASAQRRRL